MWPSLLPCLHTFHLPFVPCDAVVHVCMYLSDVIVVDNEVSPISSSLPLACHLVSFKNAQSQTRRLWSLVSGFSFLAVVVIIIVIVLPSPFAICPLSHAVPLICAVPTTLLRHLPHPHHLTHLPCHSRPCRASLICGVPSLGLSPTPSSMWSHLPVPLPSPLFCMHCLPHAIILSHLFPSPRQPDLILADSPSLAPSTLGHVQFPS